VSPIIATILLVAITVVLAAVLYVLVSGLTKSGASTPYSLGMTSSSPTGTAPNIFEAITMSPTSGLTTGMFALSVTGSGGAVVAVATAAPGACVLTATPTTFTTTICPGPTSGWYAVILTSGSGILAIYANGAWAYATGTTTVALSASYSLILISTASLATDTLTAYSTGSSSVSGSVTL
jgi:flagellin-like protein